MKKKPNKISKLRVLFGVVIGLSVIKGGYLLYNNFPALRNDVLNQVCNTQLDLDAACLELRNRMCSKLVECKLIPNHSSCQEAMRAGEFCQNNSSLDLKKVLTCNSEVDNVACGALPESCADME